MNKEDRYRMRHHHHQQQQGRMSCVLIPSYRTHTHTHTRNTRAHAHTHGRIVRRVATEVSQSSFNALWSSGSSAFTGTRRAFLTRCPSTWKVSFSLLSDNRRIRLGISRIQWPLTFKYDLTKAFEHPPAAELRYQSRILRGLFNLHCRRPRNLSLPRFRKLLLSHARRFSTVAFTLIFLMLSARQNIRRLFCASWKLEKYNKSSTALITPP